MGYERLGDDMKAAIASACGGRTAVAEEVRRQHGRGESYHADMPPDLVAFPRTTAEVSAIVRLCHGAGVPIIAFGAGTSLEGNVLALHGGVCIDLSEMNAVLRISAEDLDCTVEAGVTRLQLNRDLRDTGLFFPIDPGADATIGGMAATRASGTNAVRYGTMRDAVLSLTVVLADGAIVTTGGRARKSSAGYDMTRLFVGSEGTLGIITEVTLRLHGIPESTQVGRCTFTSLDDAVATVSQIVQMGIPIARVELADAAQMRAINLYSKTDYPEHDTLFFECHGAASAVPDQMALVQALALDNGGSDWATAQTAEDRNRLWQARHDALYATTAQRPGSKGFITDVCVPVSQLAQCVALARSLVDATSVPATIVGHVGDGNFHVICPIDPASATERGEMHELTGALSRLAISLGGTCTGEHGIGSGKLDYMALEHGDSGVAAMRLVKRALDPRGILNPGKVLPPLAQG
ncbi:FAD-binding oxidoreductase [Sphingomonas sp.]|uniref:FAD-binding oxidoreductase n=1 Tax=Sphingomonas sp. TaxID=28214 RepID=UPI002DD66A89|nr:FAD-linked oxidase C-terminal domain-containing protein [Sphingomonas sp.]